MSHPVNNPELVRQQYLTDERFRARLEIHDKYSDPQSDFVRWAIGTYDWRGDEHVLDVGSGPGRYQPMLAELLPDVSYTGLDLLPGMLNGHPAKDKIVLGDAQHLPYPDDSFDVVMANHMLFHVPDVDRAVEEMRRVLTPDGVLIAATNSEQHMPELQFLLRRCVMLLAPQEITQVNAPIPPSQLFSLESGTRQLARHFFAVVRHDLPGSLVFKEADPVIKYIESTRLLREPQLPKGVSWEAVMLVLRDQVERLTAYGGELRIAKLSGVLIASDRGGFITSFLEHQKSHNSA